MKIFRIVSDFIADIIDPDVVGVGIFMVLLFLINIVLLGLIIMLYGWVCMLLWNWLVPSIFGFVEITFWQSCGLILLSFIFFHGGSPKIKANMSK